MLSFLAIVLVTKFFIPKRSLSTLKINSHFYFLFPNARKNWRKIFVKVEKGWNEKTLKIWEAYLGNNWLKCFPIIIVTKKTKLSIYYHCFFSRSNFFYKSTQFVFFAENYWGVRFFSIFEQYIQPQIMLYCTIVNIRTRH